MKTRRLLFSILLLISCEISFGDVIPENSHYVTQCAQITNVRNYPDISLLGYVIGVSPSMSEPTYEITPGMCLTCGYKDNGLSIFAVRKSYLTGKDITAIDWTKDKNAIQSDVHIYSFGGYLEDTNPIIDTELFYRIVGFTETSVVLYKWKEINKFSNGKQDSTTIYTFNGDSTKLSQKIITKVTTIHSNSTVELYPNPAHKNLLIKLNNNYQGEVSMVIHSMEGKEVKSIHVSKSATFTDYSIPVDNLARGMYFVNISFGNSVISKKFNIK